MSLPTPDTSSPVPPTPSHNLHSTSTPLSISLAAPQLRAVAPKWESPITPSTFVSILPILDEVLGKLASLAESETGIDGVEAGKSVVGTARELFGTLERMKVAAMDLPGGDMSTERIEGLIEMMKGEADRRRETLKRLAEVDMPIADTLRQSTENAAGGELIDGESAGTEGAQTSISARG